MVVHFSDSFFSVSENGFTQRDMAKMLGVSLRTIENRLSEYNMTNSDRYSEIDDVLLDAHVERIVAHFPRSGINIFVNFYSGFSLMEKSFEN